MTPDEIAERLIRAAEIEQAGNRVGPAPLRAQQLPYVHSEEDMRNWGHRRGERRSRKLLDDACRLRPEDADAHALYRREFFEKLSITARDVSEAEEALSWYALVKKDQNRAALAAWVECMADNKRLFFKDWCKKQGIAAKTGRERKNRAIEEIHASLVRRTAENCEDDAKEGFLRSPENGHIDANIADEPDESRGVLTWRSDAAFTSIITDQPADFSWAQKRWERRKQKQAAKRKQEAA